MVTNVLQLLCIYARKQNEVIVIRRILTCTVSVLLLLGAFLLPMRAEAATADSKAGVVTTASGKLNVRSSPSSSAAVAASLNKGSYVTLISKSGDWWKVEYAKGKYGYCHAGFITVTEGTPVSVAVSSGTLNVRSGAGTAYGKVGTLSKGETVIRLSTANGWSRVLYGGTKTGYVSAQYLSGNYASVSLNVPNFKQTDARWGGCPDRYIREDLFSDRLRHNGGGNDGVLPHGKNHLPRRYGEGAYLYAIGQSLLAEPLYGGYGRFRISQYRLW